MHQKLSFVKLYEYENLNKNSKSLSPLCSLSPLGRQKVENLEFILLHLV